MIVALMGAKSQGRRRARIKIAGARTSNREKSVQEQHEFRVTNIAAHRERITPSGRACPAESTRCGSDVGFHGGGGQSACLTQGESISS